METIARKRRTAAAVAVAAVAAVGAVAAVTMEGCSTEHACTLIGCQSAAYLHVPLTVRADALGVSSVNVCRNGACVFAMLPPPPTEVGTGAPVAFPAGSAVAGIAWLREGRAVELELTWVLPDQQAMPGTDDLYVVMFTLAGGAPTTVLEETARYVRSTPNGEDCGPVCWQASLGGS